MFYSVVATTEDPQLTEVFFEPAHYTVMENVGSMEVRVKRAGSNLNSTLCVDYSTADEVQSLCILCSSTVYTM